MPISDKTKRFALYYTIVALAILFVAPIIKSFIIEVVPITGDFFNQIASFFALFLLFAVLDLVIRRFVLI